MNKNQTPVVAPVLKCRLITSGEKNIPQNEFSNWKDFMMRDFFYNAFSLVLFCEIALLRMRNFSALDFVPYLDCLYISYNKTPVATDTLRLSIFPQVGIETIESHCSFKRREIPVPSLPITRTDFLENFQSSTDTPPASAP